MLAILFSPLLPEIGPYITVTITVGSVPALNVLMIVLYSTAPEYSCKKYIVTKNVEKVHNERILFETIGLDKRLLIQWVIDNR